MIELKLKKMNIANNMTYMFWCTVISLTITLNGKAQVHLNVHEGACKFQALSSSYYPERIISYHCNKILLFFPETLSRATLHLRLRSKLVCFKHNVFPTFCFLLRNVL